jgi:prephenate dehydrogenase
MRAKVGENGTRRTAEVGIIGMGDMGRLYASKLVEAGWQ